MPTICFKAESFWGCSSVGRALRSQCRGREFESHQLHHEISLLRVMHTIKKFLCRAVAGAFNGKRLSKDDGLSVEIKN